MLNTIYLYVEHYGSAWEPAEGGCFVETSFIEEETMEELHQFGRRCKGSTSAPPT